MNWEDGEGKGWKREERSQQTVGELCPKGIPDG